MDFEEKIEGLRTGYWEDCLVHKNSRCYSLLTSSACSMGIWSTLALLNFIRRIFYNLGQNCWENCILDSIFLNIVAVPVLPSPPSPESNVVVYSKESLIPGRLWEATLNWGKGFSFRKGVVLEIVLLRRRVDMMGKTFSSSFVRDCSYVITHIKRG